MSCTYTPSSVGQDYSVGLKIGVSGNTLSGSSDTELRWRSAFSGGFSFNARFFNSIAVQPELIYVVKGAKTDNIFQSGEPTGFEGIFSFSYLDFPVLLMLTPQTRTRIHPKVFAGPHLSYQLDASIEQIDPNSGNSASESVDTIPDTDLGLVFGGGADVEIRGELVTFDIRYIWSKKNLRPNVPDNPLYNRGILFLVGVSF
ncbi:MAG: PorT family protein [Rhodothermales bacterium]|nr:PorT family protein [Rhodothermales bacterium]